MSATRHASGFAGRLGKIAFDIKSEDEGVRTNYQAFKRNAGVDYVPSGFSRATSTPAIAARELWPVLTKRENLFGHPAINAEN